MVKSSYPITLWNWISPVPRHVMPKVPLSAQVIVDVGCGVGQTLMALNPGVRRCALLVGMDVDQAAVGYGRLPSKIRFIVGGGVHIPLKDGTVDFAILRVALPYMRLHTALSEIHRVLKPGGRAWFALHSRRMYVRKL